MPALTDDEFVHLALNLPAQKRRWLLQELLRRSWPEWEKHAAYTAQRARETALARGKNWDAMTEEEREDFVNDVIDED